MADIRVLLLLVLSFVFVNCAVLSGIALFCRDPETGKLHAVNTTWASGSFCGNYTCKIRKRNISHESTPIRQLNVTNLYDHNVKNKTIATFEKKAEPDIQPLLHKNRVSNSNNMINLNAKSQFKSLDENFKRLEENQKYEPKSYHFQNNEHPKSSEDSDRYLTEKEIDNIAELLHTVKKSDIDAIVDIYNLAQEIYKELDEATDKEIIEEAIHLIEEEGKHKSNCDKSTSYSYNILDSKDKLGLKYDMDIQSTHTTHSTSPKPKSDAATFFSGLSSQDYGKLPYYYPITDFQRTSSYTYSPSTTTTKKHKDCSEAEKKNISRTKSHATNNQPDVKPQKLIQPSHFLPYPFTNIHHKNLNESNNIHKSKTPWTLGYYHGYKYYQPYYNGFVTPIRKAILVNPHLSSEIQDIEQKPVRNIENKELLDNLLGKNKATPAWKTKPLSIEVLKDIRANIDNSKLIKAFPLRKNIKLERPGKLITIDEMERQLKRRKRSIDTERTEENRSSDYEEFETYLEKVVCQDRIEPGYFRVGNMSQPYPSCCPQKILTLR